MTPPRSMSPTSTTGTFAARAKPMLAMSLRRRLTSDALPAPSTRTRSASALSCAKLASTCGIRLGLHVLILRSLGGADDATLDHDLRSDLALRLEQHRIHVHGRRRSRRAGLQRLGAADFAAVHRHRGVVGHVLRLERPHLEPAIGVSTREPRDDQRFADVGTGPLNHQCAGGHLISWRGCMSVIPGRRSVAKASPESILRSKVMDSALAPPNVGSHHTNAATTSAIAPTSAIRRASARR